MIYIPLPGEYVASAIKRGNEIYGQNRLSKADYLIIKSPMKIEKNAKEGEIKFPALFKHRRVKQKVLYENTLFPLTAALGRTRASTIYTPTTSWKICLKCIAEDLETLGTAYIHCRHLLASVSICSIHGSKLYYRCPTCLKTTTTHNIYEFAQCCKFYQDSQQEIGSPQHNYSIFINDLLNFNNPPYKLHFVENLLVIKLKIMKYLNFHGTELLIENIKHQLGLDLRFRFFHNLALDVCAVSAFLAFNTADNYLKAMNDKSFGKALYDEFRELRM